MLTGRIHSIESAGLVDGPGIRTVVFFQGCSLRCAYCHNPDTWSLSGGVEVTSEELINKILRFRPYFQTSGGGVTFSGGEPLLQSEFLKIMLKLCKDNGIHTAIDTAGYGFGNYEDILKYTDLVLLDIKHVDDIGYKSITGKSKYGFEEFLKAAQLVDVPLWVRHVVVPGITDSEEHIIKLAHIIKNIKNVEKIELLPYHTMAIKKYDELGIEYRLKNVPAMDKKLLERLESIIKITT